jgi:hypothetical protein
MLNSECQGDFGDGQFYLSHIGVCTLDSVIWLATLFRRGLWRYLMDYIGCSAEQNEHATYHRRESARVLSGCVGLNNFDKSNVEMYVW